MRSLLQWTLAGRGNTGGGFLIQGRLGDAGQPVITIASLEMAGCSVTLLKLDDELT